MPTWWPLVVLGGFLITAVTTPLLGILAQKNGLLDHPDGKRKLHTKPVPLVGGYAIALGIVIPTSIILCASDYLTSGDIGLNEYAGYAAGASILLLGGFLDDKYNLRARYSALFPVVAAIAVALFGVGVSKVTNPLGGAFMIPAMISALITFVWVLCVTYTTKLLDGLDGLSSGVSGVGMLVIATIALSPSFFQPDVGLVALICAAAVGGFLLYNIAPARAYLGEGGSTLLGFTLGVLSVISGSKFATLLMVIGVPALDVAFVMIRRKLTGAPLFSGDRRHLHHSLIDRGFSPTAIVSIYIGIAALFGGISVFLPSIAKVVALFLVSLVAIGLTIYSSRSRV